MRISSLIFCIMLIGCFDIPKTGVQQASPSVNFSKEIGVFKNEYKPLERNLTLNGTNYLIEEVWVEDSWNYKNIWKEVEVLNSTNLYIKCSEKINYLDFKINKNSPVLIGYSGGKLVTTLTQYPNTITLSFEDNQNIQFLKEVN